MQQGFARLLAQPLHDRDTVVSEHEERSVGVADDARRFLRQDPVQ
jgi:hypothetical protein